MASHQTLLDFKYHFYISLLGFLLFSSHAHADDALLKSTNTAMNFTFETLTLDEFDDEKMGLFGGSLWFELDDYPWLSLGAASYGTVTGNRGGFITLGFASELNMPLNESLTAHTGVFVGGGGGHGGYKLQGGGFMLRSHLGMRYDSDFGNVGLGVSQIAFPNGHVNSGQFYTSYTNDFSSLLPQGWLERTEHKESLAWSPANDYQFGMVYRTYRVPQGVLTSTGGPQHQRIDVLGAEWQQQWGDFSFMSIEAQGAMGGQSDGYLQILLGMGLYYPITDDMRIKLSASAGVAGGGDVDTGGGLLTDIGIAIQKGITDDTALEFEALWVDSIYASFKAQSYALKWSQTFSTPKLSADESIYLSQLSDYTAQHFRIRAVQQTYMKPANATDAWRDHHTDRDVNLLGFQNDYFINDIFFLSGQGIAAYEGQAGGYMVGYVGMGVSYPWTETWGLEAEVLAGASGGGGLAVAGGLAWQINAGLSYKTTENYSVLIEVGRMNATQGAFAANVFSLSAAYHFSLFMK